jgi:chorismate synthase
MQRYELAVIRRAVARVLRKVGARRARVTADRSFAGVVLFKLLAELGVAFVSRVKGSTKF